MTEHELRNNSHAEAEDSEFASKPLKFQIKILVNEVLSLFSKEVALAKSEFRESIGSVKVAIGEVATGLSILQAGFVILLLSAVYGLATIVEMWLAALIIGGIAVIIGIGLIGAAKKKLSADEFTPRHTLQNLKEDKRAVKGAIQ